MSSTSTKSRVSKVEDRIDGNHVIIHGLNIRPQYRNLSESIVVYVDELPQLIEELREALAKLG